MHDPKIARVFIDQPPRPADLALVFGYHVPEGAERRARRAAGLYLGGLVPRLLFSGGGPRDPGGEAESVRMARVAVAMGVPAEAILIEQVSGTTAENVLRSLELLQEAGLLEGTRAILLVSCAWHMGRIVRLMKTRFPTGTEFIACPQREDCTAETWQDCPECRRRVRSEADFLDDLIRAGALPESL